MSAGDWFAHSTPHGTLPKALRIGFAERVNLSFDERKQRASAGKGSGRLHVRFVARSGDSAGKARQARRVRHDV